jgi:hypothetical protein
MRNDHDLQGMTISQIGHDTGVKSMRKLLKHASPAARVLLVVAEPCDECEPQDDKIAHHVAVLSNMAPLLFFKAFQQAIEDADSGWKNLEA